MWLCRECLYTNPEHMSWCRKCTSARPQAFQLICSRCREYPPQLNDYGFCVLCQGAYNLVPHNTYLASVDDREVERIMLFCQDVDLSRYSWSQVVHKLAEGEFQVPASYLMRSCPEPQLREVHEMTHLIVKHIETGEVAKAKQYWKAAIKLPWRRRPNLWYLFPSSVQVSRKCWLFLAEIGCLPEKKNIWKRIPAQHLDAVRFVLDYVERRRQKVASSLDHSLVPDLTRIVWSHHILYVPN